MKKLKHIKLFESFNVIEFKMPNQFNLPKGYNNNFIYLVHSTDGNSDSIIYLVDYEGIKKLYNSYNFSNIIMAVDNYRNIINDDELNINNDDWGDPYLELNVIDKCDSNNPVFNCILYPGGNAKFYKGDDKEMEYLDDNTEIDDGSGIDFDNKILVKFPGINKCLVVPHYRNLDYFDKLTGGKAITDLDIIIKNIEGNLDEISSGSMEKDLTEDQINSVMVQLIDNYVDIEIINRIKNVLFHEKINQEKNVGKEYFKLVYKLENQEKEWFMNIPADLIEIIYKRLPKNMEEFKKMTDEITQEDYRKYSKLQSEKMGYPVDTYWIKAYPYFPIDYVKGKGKLKLKEWDGLSKEVLEECNLFYLYILAYTGVNMIE